MNNLLIFFAIPIAIIIISIILQKLLNSPVSVAALIFAIFLVVTFAAFDATFLIATLAYTILAFITALFINFFCQRGDGENTERNGSGVLNNILTGNDNNSNCNNSAYNCNRYRRF